MIAPDSLYETFFESGDKPVGLPLIGALSGFTDAGGAIKQLAEHIFDTLEYELIVEFKNDELLDYRSRRPVMFFEKDHIASYSPPVLAIYLVFDEAGEPFLFLHGYEPDFKWEAFADAIKGLIEELQITSFTWVHAVPFPIPHTKPIGITVSGNRFDLSGQISQWKPETEVPGNVMHLLEYRLSALGLPTVGFVFLTPHYLADNEFPAVTLAAFEQITVANGLVFPTDEIREANQAFVARLNEQISQNADLTKMISKLEADYADESSGPIRTPISSPTQGVPTADQIANELEDYLASRRRNRADEED
jgi:hypothetical protein